jgi:hypothetical protein
MWRSTILLAGLALGCGGQARSHEATDEAREASIYELRNPESSIEIGTSVVLDSPELRVTASSANRVFVQEAGGTPYCEEDPAPVAYRGIAVHPSAPSVGLVPGQRVRVSGRLDEIDGNTTVVDATIDAIGAPAEPYLPYCDRDATRLASEALESVLTRTAGSTEQQREPESSGVWRIDSCLSDPMTIGGSMYVPDDWAPSWYWVNGVLVQTDDGTYRVEPRNRDDVSGGNGDDVCL